MKYKAHKYVKDMFSCAVGQANTNSLIYGLTSMMNILIMNYEYKDYRRKPPPPSFTEWTPISPLRYCMGQIFFLFVLPFILGFSFAPIGLLFNVVLIDYIFYRRALLKEEY